MKQVLIFGTIVASLVLAGPAIAQSAKKAPAGIPLLDKAPAHGDLGWNRGVLVKVGCASGFYRLMYGAKSRRDSRPPSECVLQEREDALPAPAGLVLLNEEPRAGTLDEGEQRLINNSYCTDDGKNKNMIELLIGGSSVNPRSYKCVLRPERSAQN